MIPNCGQAGMVNHPSCTVLGFIPSDDIEGHSTVQFGHYCCLVTRASLPLPQLEGGFDKLLQSVQDTYY